MKKLILLGCIYLLWLSARSQDPAYPAPAIPLDIVRVEYFVDVDPGFGNGIAIPQTPAVDLVNLNFNVNTTGLSNGAHRLFVRSLSSEGHWSLIGSHEFLVDFDPAYTTLPALQNVRQAEFFVDTDPGIGNGIPVTLTPSVDLTNLPFVVNTTSLSIGGHRLYVRSRNNEGRWSLTATHEFLIDSDPAYLAPPAPLTNITQAEYFINTDPGFGNGVSIPITQAIDINNFPVTINTASLPAGSTNQLIVRSRSSDGQWSVSAVRTFVVDIVSEPPYPPVPAAPGNITYAEYFFNTDPGFGNATPITLTASVDIANLTFAANTLALPDGQHRIYVRSLDDWSLTAYTTFNKGSVLPLRFVSFSAMNRALWVDLRWETADEVNTKYFVVERSVDARNWVWVGQVASRNSAGRHVYESRDSMPLNGLSYYRLMQVDNDGRFTYSQTLAVNRRSEMIRVFPNPVTTEVQVVMKREVASLRIDLIDAAGRTQKSVAVNNPGPVVKLSMTDVPKGVYYLRIQSGSEEWTEQLIKQ